MFGFIVFVHTLVCILLVVIILMQSGRGGGLTESFSAAESMFGAKTNVVLIKTTTILAVLFLVTCLSLAFLSSKKGESLMTGKAVSEENTTDRVGQPVVKVEEQMPSVNDTKQEEKNANPTQPISQPAAVPDETKDF